MYKKTLFKRLLLVSGTNLIVATAAFAQTTATTRNTHMFSAQQCVAYAAKNNAQVKNALLGIQIQEQTNRTITAAAMPQINGSVGATHYLDVPVQSFPNFIAAATYGVLSKEGVKNGSGQAIAVPSDFGFVQAQFGTKYNANAGISVQQLLFDGQVFVGLQARAASLEYQRKNVEVTEEAIKVNIYKIYYQLVLSKTQIDLLNANISRLEKLRHDAAELYKNGFVEKLDVDKLNVQIANLQTEKQKALNSITIGYLGLKTLMGMPIKDSLVLTDAITENDIKTGLLSDTSKAYLNRKEYQYLQVVRKLNEYNIKRYKLSYIPTIALSASYSKQAQRNKFDFFNKGDWFTASLIGLNMSVPIFDGFSKDSKIKQSKLELQQTDNTIDNLKLSIDNETERANISFQSAIATLDFQKKNMQLSESVYNQTKKKYEVGTGSNTEITAAQTDLKTAQTNYIAALYDAIIAKVDYLKAIGKL